MVTVYELSVKKWMTKKSTDEFDFMKKFNKDVPMPFLKMAAFTLKETPKMLYMRCRGEIFTESTDVCMCCGRPITNPVSRYFGLGPICGNHDYTVPEQFANYADLRKAVDEYREEHLHKVIWEGWIPKSAIVEMKPMNDN